jgi:hypothetical protein
MKKFLLLVMVVTSALTGFAQVDSTVKAPRQKHHKMHQQYSCPMHPEMKSDKPGKCTECGMDLQASKKEKMKMTHYCCPMHPEVTSDKAGTCSKCGMDLKASKKEQMKMKEMHGYSCPMHPDEKSDMAGKCAKCGMDMKPVKAKKQKS